MRLVLESLHQRPEHVTTYHAVSYTHLWDAPVRAKSRLRTKPKRYFADPSIPAAALGMGPERLLSDGQAFGLLFESLCVHDLRAYTCLLYTSRCV